MSTCADGCPDFTLQNLFPHAAAVQHLCLGNPSAKFLLETGHHFFSQKRLASACVTWSATYLGMVASVIAKSLSSLTSLVFSNFLAGKHAESRVSALCQPGDQDSCRWAFGSCFSKDSVPRAELTHCCIWGPSPACKHLRRGYG